MASITAVQLIGFQSHINSDFHLGPGLNVITGPSDAGKTAIIRAIRWVAFNEPAGEAFLNESVGEAQVTIELDSQYKIMKHRKKGKTSYTIADPFGGQSVFEKSEVPIEVKQLLGIEKQTFGDFETTLNFAFQLDAPFLISETASAGAKILGKLAGTESVDLAIKGVSKDTHAARQERIMAEKDIERTAAALLEFQGLDDAKESLELAETLFNETETLFNQLENYKQYRNSYEMLLEKLVLFGDTLERLAHLPALEEDVKDIEKAQYRYDQLLQLYSQYSLLQNRIEELGHRVLNFQHVEALSNDVEVITMEVDKLSMITSLFQSYQKYAEEINKNTEILHVTEHINELPAFIQQAEVDLTTITKLDNLTTEYSNAWNARRMAQNRFETFGELTQAEESLQGISAESERLAELQSLYAELSKATQADYLADHKMKSASHVLSQANQELNQAWEAAGGTCPLCDQPLLSHTH